MAQFAAGIHARLEPFAPLCTYELAPNSGDPLLILHNTVLRERVDAGLSCQCTMMLIRQLDRFEIPEPWRAPNSVLTRYLVELRSNRWITLLPRNFRSSE